VGPGTKVHRILRRVLIDGRHPGSSRAVGFHEQAVTVVSAASSHSKKRRRRSGSKERKRERRQGCQRLDRTRAPWEQHAHARSRNRQHLPGTRQRHTHSKCVLDDPPKRFERRESARSPGQAVRSPNSGRHPRGESRGSVAGNVRGAGARSFVRVAEVDRTHRASCPSGGRKSSWRETRQGASRKEARSSTDAEHEQVEGEPVREYALTIKSTRVVGLWVSACRFSRRRKALSGSRPSRLYRWGEARVLWLAGQTRSEGRKVFATGSASGGTETDSGVPASDEESVRDRHGPVKAAPGPRRTAGCSHPRR